MKHVRQICLSLSLIFMAAATTAFGMQDQSVRDTLKESLLINDVGYSEEIAACALNHATDDQVKKLHENYLQLLGARNALTQCKKKKAIENAQTRIESIRQEIAQVIADLLNQAQKQVQLVVIDDWIVDDSSEVSQLSESQFSKEESSSDVSQLSEEDNYKVDESSDVSTLEEDEDSFADNHISVNQSASQTSTWTQSFWNVVSEMAESSRGIINSILTEIVTAEDISGEGSEEYNDAKLLEGNKAVVNETAVSNALVVYKDPAEIVHQATQAIVNDHPYAALEMVEKWLQSSPDKNSESLLARIERQQHLRMLAELKEEKTVPFFGNDSVIHGIKVSVKPEDDKQVEILENILNQHSSNNRLKPAITTVKDQNGKVIAELFEDGDEDHIIDSTVTKQNEQKVKVPLNTKAYSLKALSKPLMIGLLGVCGISALCWKLYTNSSYYQCALLKNWQHKVATVIASLGTKDSNNTELPALELSRLTRLTDTERERLKQAHDSLLLAFDKAQKTVVASVATDVSSHSNNQAVDQIPVVKELKAVHGQWDTAMNDCKNKVKSASMRFW